MLELMARSAVLIGAGALWVAGLRLFLRSDLARARKVRWTAVLVFVGIGIGVVLPLAQVWSRFLLVLLILPILSLADVFVFRSGRGIGFWIRACGFEVCTVFAVAAAARLLLDLTGVAAFGRAAG
jgi:glucose-6-phosphate-specific signal transduction histidine kinase